MPHVKVVTVSATKMPGVIDQRLWHINIDDWYPTMHVINKYTLENMDHLCIAI